MMTRLVLAMFAALLMTAPHIGAQQSSPALEKLFASAQHKATVAGDLKGAIDDYERIVAAAGKDRAAAAQALLRMAEAYQKLGDAEAMRIYERLVREYQDQNAAASVARTRLASTPAERAGALTTERVLEIGRPHDRISPDGRYIARGNTATGNLELLDLRNGAPHVLTNDRGAAPPEHMYPLAVAFSRDGRQIAYQWYVEEGNRSVLRAVSTTSAAGRPRTIYQNPDVEFAPTDWSPDGKWIVGVARRSDRTSQIAIVGMDGTFLPLRSVEWSRTGGARFSPNSARLAFHMPATEGGFARDVYVITLGQSPKQTVVAASAGDDALLEWTPDGQALLIASDRGGTTSVWRVPADGRDGGSQYALVRSDIGVVSSLGPTRSGALYYHLMPGVSNVYVADFDQATGQLSSLPRSPIKQFRGTTGLSQWSPDGRFIVHESWRDIPAPINVTRPVIAFVSADSGEVVREVPFAVSYGSMGSLSPDGRAFITRGADLKGRSGQVRVDATTGAATVVTNACGAFPMWTRDATSFFCAGKGGLHQVEAESGRILRTIPTEGQAHSISPDGRYVITRVENVGLKRLTVATGEHRLLLQLSGSDYTFDLTGFEWTPDASAFLFYGKVKGDEGMWLVPVDGRAPHRIRLDKGLISSWRFHPTTNQVVFSVGAGRWQLEVWKLDVPSAGAAKTAAGQ
jgi:Tol biopolymer transport system component